jgi:hypothetical protein
MGTADASGARGRVWERPVALRRVALCCAGRPDGLLATVGIGFIAFPSASVTWWLRGDFTQAERAGFVGGQQNQSLRGLRARLVGSVDGSQASWLAVAAVVTVAGLAAAVLLRRRGFAFAGLMKRGAAQLTM